MTPGTQVIRKTDCKHVKKGSIGTVLTNPKNKIVEVQYDHGKFLQFTDNLKKAADSNKGKHMIGRGWGGLSYQKEN